VAANVSYINLPAEEKLAQAIGNVLRELRKQRGFSLNELAQLSGVSRSMLSQIETGRSVPTVLVLCKIAQSFDVPVTTFLKTDSAESPLLISGEETPLRISADGRCAWRTLTPENSGRKIEFYELTLRAGCIEHVPAYSIGTKANLAVNEGWLVVAINSRRYQLTTGDVLEFSANTPHSYINLSEKKALAYLVIRHTHAVN
jgi:transcriptional regulator with XRE-family HTH domain